MRKTNETTNKTTNTKSKQSDTKSVKNCGGKGCGKNSKNSK